MDSSEEPSEVARGIQEAAKAKGFWFAPRVSGAYSLSGAVQQVRGLLQKLGVASVAVARKTRPRLAKALGFVGHVGVCTVSGPVLLMCIDEILAQDGVDEVLEATESHPLRCCVQHGEVLLEREDRDGIDDNVHCQYESGTCVCEELVFHLAQYAMYRKRDLGLLRSLADRAVSWRERMGEAEECFARYAPLSIMVAFGLSDGEKAATVMLNSARVREAIAVTSSGYSSVPTYRSYGQAFAVEGWGGMWRLLRERRTRHQVVEA